MIKQNELIVLYYQLISEYLLFYFFLHPILIVTNTSIPYGVYIYLSLLTPCSCMLWFKDGLEISVYMQSCLFPYLLYFCWSTGYQHFW